VSPSSQRWRPRRAGIVNLYEYSDQVFDFAGGRLLLRGHNTSGKTKALELLLPFCLDGDISPTKLDPFASAYKDMKWNLVGCTDHEQRVGYVWLEFERLNEDGATQRLTAGIGLRANKSLPNVTRWHFLARDRIVGEDLSLLHGRDPIAKAELAAELGDDGEVIDNQRDYRTRLNDLLFGFAGEEQYQTMLRLMRDLRRPHLSKTLDPRRVAEQLTVGLPKVDEALMRRLAGGLEQLETLERGLARLRDVRERVQRFHQRTYSAYARAIVRERAETLRAAQTGVENAAERLRSTQARLDAEHTRAQDSTAEREAAEADAERLSAEEHALICSAAWSSVAEVEALREHADAQKRAAVLAREHADSAAANASTLEAESIAAQAAAAEQREQASTDLDNVVELGTSAGVGKRVEMLASQLRDGGLGPETWGSLLRDLANDWRDVLRHHHELLTAALTASAEAVRARADERESAARLEQILARLTTCEQELESARDALTVAFASWREDLVELELDDQTTGTALELAYSGSSPAPAISGCVERARSALADERSALQAQRQSVTDTVAAAEGEIERLQAAHEDGPQAPAWSRAERTAREGAPLWRLVDFNSELTVTRRASLEAALEASGLLDAWVTPSGQLEDPELADIVLAGGEPTGGASLLDVLVPLAAQPVGETVVAKLLHGVGLGERSSGAWIDLDGRFALGPLVGRATKSQPQHIGAAAREAHRAARIAELRAHIEGLETEIAACETQIDEVDGRRATLQAELEALPPLDAVTSALDSLRVTSMLEAEAKTVHEQLASAAQTAAESEIAADAARREHGAMHGLPSPLDTTGLERLRDASAELVSVAATTARAWVLVERETEAAQKAATRLATEHTEAKVRDERARDENAESQRLAAEHLAREQALGATGEELRRRHAKVVSALKSARDTHRHAGEAAQQALIALATLERDAGQHAQEHETARRHRESASAGFRSLAQAGILQLVLTDAAPADAGRASEWTFTRTLEVARALPEELLSVRSGAGELAVTVQREVQLLDRELADADMGAYASRGENDLLLVHVTEGGGEQTLGQLLDTLAADIADSEQILTTEERRVFNDALVEEIADHMRQRIHEVRGRVEQMNAVLRRSPTAAGKTVELEWRPLDDDEGRQRAALALLRRDVRHLDQGSRHELVAFFRERIDDARHAQTDSGEPQSMADTLMDAFDYRQWFAFALYERSDTGRVHLTKQRHAVGSGGEQSVLIHLPLFAAAAALYGDTQAPRLIMLDEALSGIDDETRERVLAATVAFDLDIVMTSHELWGTYRSVPQLSIYQLHRENGTPGVHAIPYVWDGEVLRELEQSELLV
jgi:uncharacterized protein (TIGR02680 family)